MYLRKLVPLEDLIANLGSGAGPAVPSARSSPGPSRAAAPPSANPKAAAAAPVPAPSAAPIGRNAPAAAAGSTQLPLKDALLAEIRRSKGVFYNTVVAQAQRIEATDAGVTFTFSSNQRALRDMFEQNRAWLESVAQQLAGRKVAVSSAQAEAPAGGAAEADAGAASADRKSALREQALADSGVQALLQVFPAEIRDVEEM
jgi:hypothetical protein